MKNIISLLLVWFYAGSFSWAQEGWTLWYNQNQFEAADIPSTLMEKQHKLMARPHAVVQALGLAPDGGWTIAYSNTHQTSAEQYLSWNGTHKDFMTSLEGIRQEGGKVQQIVFSPLNTYKQQSWVIVYDNKEVVWKNIPTSLIQKIIALNQANRTIKSIGLAINGGWVLVADQKEVFWELIPDKMIAQLQQLQQEQKAIHFVSFNLDNGWLILYDQHQALGEKVPSTLIEKIKSLASTNASIKGVNFYTIKGKL